MVVSAFNIQRHIVQNVLLHTAFSAILPAGFMNMIDFTFPVDRTTQPAHDVKTTLYRRYYDLKTAIQRCSDVVCSLGGKVTLEDMQGRYKVLYSHIKLKI